MRMLLHQAMVATNLAWSLDTDTAHSPRQLSRARRWMAGLKTDDDLPTQQLDYPIISPPRIRPDMNGNRPLAGC